jgi:drug/metabolite transporter (DMT)-like permease
MSIILTHNIARIGILMLAFITGSNYLVMKLVVAEMSASSTIVWRFIFATIFLLPFIRSADGIKNKQLWLKGGGTGIILGAALSFLAAALIYAGSGETSFWVSSDAAFVPILSFFLFKKIPSRRTILGTVLALIGLGLLSITHGLEFREGSILGIISAIFFAIWLIALSHIAKGYNALSLGIVQVCSALIVTLIFSLSIDSFSFPNSVNTWLSCIYLGFIGTGFRFVTQSYLQQKVNATDTALLYLIEPVIAAVLGYIFLTELLTWPQIGGCILILFGVGISQINIESEIELTN